ncbi:cytochrome p450, partial [Trifolium pratense]
CDSVPVGDPRPVRWEKPEVGCIKCNADAAFAGGSGVTSMSLCFRNTNGQFVAGLSQWQQPVYSVVEGEAWALLHAMKEVIHRGFEQVQFESDSELLIDAIHSRRPDNSEFNSIINDIIPLMSSSNVNFEVKFVTRQANLIAHTLARAAKIWVSFHRFEIIPLCIEHLLVNDMN